MRHKVKNTVLALFCSILFVCAAAFALGVFDMSESKIARAENGTVEYESITVSFVSDIYTSDTTAALIKSRLNVTGSTAEGEQEVIAPEYYSVTVNGMASGWTLQTAYANTIEVSYTNPSGGVLKANASRNATAVRLGRIDVNLIYTDDGNGNYTNEDGETVYIYDNFANAQTELKEYLIVTAYNNDGTMVKVLSAEEYTITDAPTAPGAMRTISLSYSDGSTTVTGSIQIMFTENAVEELQTDWTQGEHKIYSSSSVSNSLLPDFSVWAIMSDGSRQELATREYTLSGYLYDEANRAAGTEFTEMLTLTYIVAQLSRQKSKIFIMN